MSVSPIIKEVANETKFYVVVIAETGSSETSSQMCPGRPIFTSRARRGFYRGGECATLAEAPTSVGGTEDDDTVLVGILCAHATRYSESNGSCLWSCPLIVAGPVRMLVRTTVKEQLQRALMDQGGCCAYGKRYLRWREAAVPLKTKQSLYETSSSSCLFKRRRLETKGPNWKAADQAPVPIIDRLENGRSLYEWEMPVILQ